MLKPWDIEASPIDTIFKNKKCSLKGLDLHTYTNEHGEDWWAFVDNEDNYNVWIAGLDIEWSWKKMSPYSTRYPWILDRHEKEWLNAVLLTAQEKREGKKLVEETRKKDEQNAKDTTNIRSKRPKRSS